MNNACANTVFPAGLAGMGPTPASCAAAALFPVLPAAPLKLQKPLEFRHWHHSSYLLDSRLLLLISLLPQRINSTKWQSLCECVVVYVCCTQDFLDNFCRGKDVGMPLDFCVFLLFGSSLTKAVMACAAACNDHN